MYGLKKEEVDERLLPFERFMNGEVMGQKKFIRNYSAGNKQKIGIISAMLHHPQLLILDEPFNFLVYLYFTSISFSCEFIFIGFTSRTFSQ